jgi:hypothetical protein
MSTSRNPPRPLDEANQTETLPVPDPLDGLLSLIKSGSAANKVQNNLKDLYIPDPNAVIPNLFSGTNVDADKVLRACHHVQTVGEDFPGFHDVRHSLEGVVPVVNTLMGAKTSGIEISDKTLELAAIAQCYHDLGYLNGTGKGHEQRSMKLARTQMINDGYTPADADLVDFMISATELSTKPDIFTQMAASNDVQLPALIKEFTAAQAKPERVKMLDNISLDDAKNLQSIREAALAACALGTFDVLSYRSDKLSKIAALRQEFIADESPVAKESAIAQIADNKGFEDFVAVPRITAFGVMGHLDTFFEGAASNPYLKNTIEYRGVVSSVNKYYTEGKSAELANLAREYHFEE